MPIEKVFLTSNRISKGTASGGEILTWTPIRDCRGLNCELYKKCAYEKTKTSGGVCGVEKKYVTGLYRTLMPVLENADSYTVQQVGMMLMPLYLQLCRFYIIEAGLPELFPTDLRGGKMYEHPVYNSIRGTIAIITSLQRTELKPIFKNAGLLTMGGIFRKALEPEPSDIEAEAVEEEVEDKALINGDPEYYKQLMEDYDFPPEDGPEE
jgi:hypothetical protein